tara:strand:- start:67 stop:654 length:588 start_codon:yes stop_codon:yes gene_type:complete
MASFNTANIVGASNKLNGALDALDGLKSGVLGGLLSIPAIPTALVTAKNTLLLAKIKELIPPLPSLDLPDINLQAELQTISGLDINTPGYDSAIKSLENKFGSGLIEKGYDIKNLANQVRDANTSITDTVERGKQIASSVPNFTVSSLGNGLFGEAKEVAQNVLTASTPSETEELSELVLNTEMMNLRESLQGTV